MQKVRESETIGSVFMLIEKILANTDNGYGCLKWKVKSWVPFVSRFLPNDEMTIYKKGNCLKIETGIYMASDTIKFGGKTTILYNPEKYGMSTIVVIDRAKGSYEKINLAERNSACPDDESLDKEIDKLVKSPVEVLDVEFEEIEFAAELKRRKIRSEKVGNFVGIEALSSL